MSQEEKDIPDLKGKIMGEIKNKKVRMICPAAVLARKIGLEGALAASILWGGFLISSLLYFLERTRLFKFLSLGMPGLKAFLYEIPYDYLALFFLALIAAVYFAGKMDLCYESRIPSFSIVPIFFIGSVLAGIVILSLGINEFFQKEDEIMTHRKKVIWGRVLELGPGEILIEEDDGMLVRIRTKEYPDPIKVWPDSRGKFLRAVGERENGEGQYFRAESILCCDVD
jgi:hypothetical protein